MKALFTVEGVVQKGKKAGRTLGYPTANIPCDDLSIPSGIFAGEVIWKGVSYHAALYKEAIRGILEAYILDFSEDIYGEKISMRALEKVRDVKVFSKQKDLIEKIEEDIKKIREIFSRG